MEAINSKSINEAALNNSKQTLSKMERALTMIDDPDFGLCCEGEEPIPFTRLMIRVVPTKQCRFGNTALFYFVNTCFFTMCCQKA